MGFWPGLADVEDKPRTARRVVKPQEVLDPLALGCNSCGLQRIWGTITTPKMKISGNLTSGDILCLAENPGEQEDKKGEPLIGPSGQLLRDKIPQRHKDRIAYQNIVRCRPPDNRTPTLTEAHACSLHLDQDIANMNNLRVIIGIGGTPLRRFFPGASIMRVHGLKFPVMVGDRTFWYYPIMHPAFMLHQARDSKRNKSAEAAESVFNADLDNLFASVDRWDDPRVATVSLNDVIIPQTREGAQMCLDTMIRPIAVDLESSKLRPYERGSELLTAAFSDGRTTIAFSCNHPSAPTTWGTDLVIDTVCKSQWIAHNAAHELSWFEYYNKTGYEVMPFDDSMAYARLLNEREGGLDLGSVSQIFLGVNVKKLSDINAEHIMDYTLEQILPYNGLDAWASARIHRRLHSKVNREAYQRLLGAIASTVQMELAGLPYDLNEALAMEKNLQDQRTKIRTDVRKLYEVRQFESDRGIEFKITSPEQVGIALVAYGKLDLPLTSGGTDGKKKQYSTEEEVLSKHAGENPLARAVLDDREISKVVTYIEPVKEAGKRYPDGMLHPTYTTMHTSTLRLSSREPNIQNYPVRKHSEIRRHIVAPPGCLFCKFDYGQLQMRIQGWASKDRNLNESIINHVDIHSYWLDQLLQVYPDYLNRLAAATGETDEKKVRKRGRDVIKSDFVFSSLFGSNADTTVERTGIPLRYVQEVLGFFWETYRGVKTWQKDQYRIYRDQGIIKSLAGQVWRGIATGTEPVNYPIQMGESEIVMECMNELHDVAKETGDFHFHPRMQIHDDLTFFLPEDNPDSYIEVIQEIMTKIRFRYQIVPLTVELKVGYNWADTVEALTFEGDWIGSPRR